MGIREALAGIAIGDAFGLGIEMQDRRWIRENIDFTKFVNVRAEKYGNNYSPGFYSDDAEHSIGVVKALMDPRPFSIGLLLEYWKNEFETDKKIKGFPRQGHGSILDWYEGKRSIEDIRELQSKKEDPGNAPPMRAIPIGFVNASYIDDYAIINADATHPHPKARAASILVARAAEHMIINDGDPEDLLAYGASFIEDSDTLSLLRKAGLLGSPDTLSGPDYELLCGPQPVPHMLQYGKEMYGLPSASMRTAVSSLYIISHSPDAFTGLKHAINIGGDVDSIAAICTGILAGRYGLESLPDFMIEQTEGIAYVAKLGSDFEHYLQLSPN
jgi:ADP-ribosylglycohydrolase